MQSVIFLFICLDKTSWVVTRTDVTKVISSLYIMYCIILHKKKFVLENTDGKIFTILNLGGQK